MIEIEAGHAGQRDDRRAQGAKGHRRGIGDEREARGGERGEAQADQDGAGHRHRGAEAGGTLEEGAEAEGDEKKLQPPVAGDAGDAVLEDGEEPFLLG